MSISEVNTLMRTYLKKV